MRTMQSGRPPVPVLDRRSLNRALLARQHLLTRATMPPEALIEHLVGMQAQEPLDPYTALWSRLGSFEPGDLATRLMDRRVVRLGLMRTTLHLATADDALELAPVFAPVLARSWVSSPFQKRNPGLDVVAVRHAASRLLAAAPRSMADLGRELQGRWPEHDAEALGYVARFHLPIVQVPPRGVWGQTGRATWSTLEAWLGRPLAETGSVDALVLRYLAAFGPASPADLRTWSWLTGLRDVVERLRPQLVRFRDAAGRELFDLPDAPRPDPETPAPPRFLPTFDNLLLSHDDRTRVFSDAAFGRLSGWVGSFLIDGFVAGQWRIDREDATATLIVEPFEPLGDARTSDLQEEGMRLLGLHAPTAADRQVTFGVARGRSARDAESSLGGRPKRSPRTVSDRR